METHELQILRTSCIVSDDVLREHIRSAMERGLPVLGQEAPHAGVAVLVGSGPSVGGQLDSIRRQRQRGRPILAIKDAHDWLIERGVIPDYAVAIDPQAHRWNCFRRKHPSVSYLIASQCHPAMFEHLADMPKVCLWHVMFTMDPAKQYPPGATLIGGCTTSGLRTITLLYTMGFRRFELYGYDSCLSREGRLRVNGDTPKEGKPLIPVQVGGRWFTCNVQMASQADEFQKLFEMMPDIFVQSYGDGLITAILRERAKTGRRGPQMRREVVPA